jgi:hypothetical protein
MKAVDTPLPALFAKTFENMAPLYLAQRLL